MHRALGGKGSYCSCGAGGWPGLYTAGILRAWFAEVEMTDVQGEWPAADAVLDTSGLPDYPLPLLKAKLELNRLASGAVLQVTACRRGLAARLSGGHLRAWPGTPWCMRRKQAGCIATGCARRDGRALE